MKNMISPLRLTVKRVRTSLRTNVSTGDKTIRTSDFPTHVPTTGGGSSRCDSGIAIGANGPVDDAAAPRLLTL